MKTIYSLFVNGKSSFIQRRLLLKMIVRSKDSNKRNKNKIERNLKKNQILSDDNV